MRSSTLIMVSLVGIAVGTGCTSRTPRLDADFGNSVRNMVDAQIYNPDAAKNPPADPPQVLDGQKGELVLKTYREDVGKPKEIERGIHIRVGQ